MSVAGVLIYRLFKWEEVDEETGEKKCTPTKVGITVLILAFTSFWMKHTYGLI